ncbi:MAG: AgmX/PglI C-terminal domain-containing protein [Deltaproteobacteria bacterium]|nr:AgmX/PglI C-terminal domain-containing protein [Deltaproteobacteria bacterium]
MSAFAIQFKVSKGGTVLREVTLSQNVIKIGRMASSHLQVDDELVSRMHAVIEAESPGQVFVIDLGSATGTLVNGKKVNKSPLNSGDTITLGGVEILVTFVAAAEQVSAMPEALAAQPQMPGSQQPQMAAYQPQVAPMPMGFGAPPAAMPPGFGMQQGRAYGAQPAPPASRRRIATPPAVQVDINSLEDASQHATEVITLWKDAVLLVNIFKAGEKKPKNFTIGEDPTCTFPITAEVLRGQTKLPLVVNHLGGGSTVTIPPDQRGDVTYDDGRRVDLADMVRNGQAQASAEASGCYGFVLPPKARVKIDVGDFTFLVNSVPNPRRMVVPMKFDWSNQIFNAASFVLHFLLVFLAFFDVPDLLGLSLDFLDDANRSVKYDMTPFEMKEKEKKEDKGDEGKKHKLEEGQMGKRDSAKTDKHYAIKGPPTNPDPRMARDMAKEAGILKYLTAANTPVSPFGAEPLGVDPENALGALLGNQIGDNFGYGGLGLRGTGRGGGGTGEGTIGLGSLGTIGHGAGQGGSGYGRGAGGLGGRRGGVPQIRSGAAMVQGSLSKEVIRRIVHRHINEVKFCYERVLASRPDLAGRVSIKFIISGSGAVQMAAVAESTIGEPGVENCIAQAVRRWVFPQPEGGGIVIVTYPFQLESGGEG